MSAAIQQEARRAIFTGIRYYYTYDVYRCYGCNSVNLSNICYNSEIGIIP